ncbi:MAG: C40 family peptidase [Pseudonocardiaceae bacterium]
MAGRSLLTVLLCVTVAVTLWAVSLVAGPVEAAPAAAPSPPAHLSAPLPPVAELRLGAAHVQPMDGAPAQPGLAQPGPAQDPLARWAAVTAPLLGIPEPALIGYGTGDLAMQDRAPGCRLSWITLAALGHVGSGQVRPQDGVPAALATAETLCAGGRDTATEAGWVAAVGSVGDGTAYVHRVLAAATTYATALRSGTPVSPPARAAIDFAIDQIGLPYVWGGNGPRRGDAGFDCSGLTTAAYATAGVGLPRTAHTQFFATRHVGVEPLQPGDLVFYGNPSTKIHHVGLYIGNGQMINAPTFGKPVQVAPVRSSGDRYAGAGRPAG